MWKLFLSLAIISGILPVILWGMVSGQNTRLMSRAAQDTELRLWLEPKEVKTMPGKEATFTLMANFDSSSRIIPKLTVNLTKPEHTTVYPLSFNYTNPFTGKVSLGELKVSSVQSGRYEIKIPDNGIDTNMTDLKAITFPAVLIVAP